MALPASFGDVAVALGEDHVAQVELCRPPENFFDRALVASLADALEALDAEDGCRVVLLCAQGRHFCAGADFRARDGGVDAPGRHLYDEAIRLFRTRKPVVAAVQGAAVGGGLGLALAADFRVAAPEARFAANFARLGFHHGFGLSVTLPRVVGAQQAALLLATGRRVKGEEALALGLCERLVACERLREEARALAREIAGSAPLAVASIRETLRRGLAARVAEALARERTEQERLQRTEDFREGVAAMAARRPPDFRGR
ncbi:MAG: enoyl-CoA hydratase/isomerase family protein [Myxococcota bacterium]|nr:enoyl-CoA hydratase/isomerase family protein [Myxococcota bacterium]